MYNETIGATPVCKLHSPPMNTLIHLIIEFIENSFVLQFSLCNLNL